MQDHYADGSEACIDAEKTACERSLAVNLNAVSCKAGHGSPGRKENPAAENALAVEAFNDLLKKHGKRQSVENPLLD